MKRKNVLFIPAWYPTKQQPTPGVFIHEHAKAVARFNDVAVIHGTPRYGLANPCSLDVDLIDGIRILHFQYPALPIIYGLVPTYFLGVFLAYRKLIREGFRADIIHAHVFTALFAARMLGAMYHIPVVATEHYSIFHRPSIRWLYKWQARCAYRKIPCILPVSRALWNAMQSIGIEGSYEIVPNTVDPDLFHPPERVHVHRKKKRILLVAIMNPIKGIPCLLEAVKKLKEHRDDFILDVVGDGEMRTEYESLTRSLGLSEDVIFHGLRTKKEVAEIMRGADFFSLSSLWENLPCVLIEAMATGLPIVATSVGGIPELIDDQTGLLVPPQDPQALHLALDSMLDRHTEYSSTAIAFKTLTRFSPMVIGTKLNDIYEQVLQRTIIGE